MPAHPIEASTWRDIASRADDLAAEIATLRQLHSQAAALASAQRAALDRIHTLREASLATLNGAHDALTSDSLEDERELLHACHADFSAALERLVSTLEHDTVEDAGRVSLDVPARHVAAVHARLADKQGQAGL